MLKDTMGDLVKVTGSALVLCALTALPFALLYAVVRVVRLAWGP